MVYPRKTLPTTVFSSGILFALVIFLFAGCTTLSESSGENARESNAYGVWTGQLPCATCPGISARLVLWQEPGFFRLTETYLDTAGGPKTFTSFGTWTLENGGETPNMGQLLLTTDDARRRLRLERLPSGDLRLLGHDETDAGPERDYVLERTRSDTE